MMKYFETNVKMDCETAIEQLEKWKINPALSKDA